MVIHVFVTSHIYSCRRLASFLDELYLVTTAQGFTYEQTIFSQHVGCLLDNCFVKYMTECFYLLDQIFMSFSYENRKKNSLSIFLPRI